MVKTPKQSPKKSKENPKKENGFVKFLRLLIYLATIIGVCLGINLIKTSSLSSAIADGTANAKLLNGQILFFTSFLFLSLNIIWGILRWFFRYTREQWKPGRIIGKLIGGGLWRTLLALPVILLSFLILAPAFDSLIVNNVLAARAEIKPISIDNATSRLEYLDIHFSDLNKDALERELSELFLLNVEFDPDAINPKTATTSLFVQNASAYDRKVKTLTNAVLSPAEKFVVFYTTTGDNAISDEDATNLAAMLDDIIQRYEDNLGFEYTYEKLTNSTTKIFGIKKVLKASNIDENILDTAMPVYVINPYENGSSVLASYAGRQFYGLGMNLALKFSSVFGMFGDDKETGEISTLYNSAPTLPFINILPKNVKNEDLPIVAAHELGHHYAGTYCYKTYQELCKTDDFIDETAPNWMAINIYPDEPESSLINRNHYNVFYLQQISSTLSINEYYPDFTGYPAVAFLENYYNIVPNAKNIILDTVAKGDALNNLYNAAGSENYQKVMTSLAEKNLTGDYGGKLKNFSTPLGETPSCLDLCTETYELHPSAMHYVYFSTEEFQNTKLEFYGTSIITASLLGQTADGHWKILTSGQPNFDYTFSPETRTNYETIALAVANSSLDKTNSFELKIINGELEDIVADSGSYDFGDFGDLLSAEGNGCYEVDMNELLSIPGQLMDLGGNFLSALSLFDDSSEVTSAKTQWEQNSAKVKNAAEEAKRQLSPYRVTVCGNYLKSGQNFDTVKAKLQSAMGANLNLIDETSDNSKFSVFVSYNLLSSHGKIYLLGSTGSEMGLLTINVEKR